MVTQTFASASSSATYTASLNPATGETACTCPAWRFKRPGQERGCKHTRQLVAPDHDDDPPPTPSVAQRQAQRDRAHAIAVRGYDAQPAAPNGVPVPKPMLASAMTKASFSQFVDDPAWVLEEKFDGHRVLIDRHGATTDVWSRPRAGKTALRRTVPAPLMAALAHLPDGQYDGELVTPGGRSWDVARLDTEKRVVLFDVLAVQGQRVMAQPYTERRALLELAVAHYTEATGADLVTVPTVGPVTADAVAAIWSRGGEGAILKRTAATYQPGRRSDDWLKVKRVGAAVCTIVGFEAGKSGPYAVTKLRADDGHETTVKTKDNATMAAAAADPDAFIGRRLVVAYCERTDSGRFRHGVWDHLAGAGE